MYFNKDTRAWAKFTQSAGWYSIITSTKSASYTGTSVASRIVKIDIRQGIG